MTESASLEDIVDGNVDVSGTMLSDVSWAHLEGNTAGSDIGYYFPAGSQTISVRKQECRRLVTGRNIKWKIGRELSRNVV